MKANKIKGHEQTYSHLYYLKEISEGETFFEGNHDMDEESLAESAIVVFPEVGFQEIERIKEVDGMVIEAKEDAQEEVDGMVIEADEDTQEEASVNILKKEADRKGEPKKEETGLKSPDTVSGTVTDKISERISRKISEKLRAKTLLQKGGARNKF